MLLDRAHCEASEAESSIERLTDECHTLRGDLQRQEALVVQRDGAIASLRDEAYTQWASRWLAFQRRVANSYTSLDLNFDIPSDEEAEESFSADCSGDRELTFGSDGLLFVGVVFFPSSSLVGVMLFPSYVR